jgi:hypothetical protein
VLHLVCACGSLVSVQPPAGARSARCRACGRVLEVPDPASLGIEPGQEPPARAPAQAPAPSHGAVPPARAPVFDADERLNLFVLEREANRLLVLGRLVLAAGLLGAGGAALLPGRTTPERGLLAAVVLFAAVAAWAGFRGARASCLASVAIAQRQREMLQRMARP